VEIVNVRILHKGVSIENELSDYEFQGGGNWPQSGVIKRKSFPDDTTVQRRSIIIDYIVAPHNKD
jgi:hypothetical protein